jgi:serine protease Do
MGPFIQHTAQVDPGNSGGPLLIVQASSPGGYAVVGINTLSALWRQAANYAIPSATARTFISAALTTRPDTYRANLDARLAAFVEGLGENRAAYPHIASYLSSACVGENAEYAMSELFDNGSRSIQQAFIQKCEDSVVAAMGYAVAWTIEKSIRGQGVIRAALKEVTGSGEEYTVVFTINNKDYSSVWIREYGIWRIRSFGEVASGDRELLARREAQRRTANNLRTNGLVNIEGGYAYLFEKGNALYLSANFMQMLGTRVYYAGSDFWSMGFFIQFQGDISVGSVAFMPYANFGFEYQHDQIYIDSQALGYESDVGFPLAAAIQGGLKITTAIVPGLYAGAGFQLNVVTLNDNPEPMKQAFVIMVGYSF